MGRVVGKVWATQKYPDLVGAKLLMVEPIDSDGTPTGRPFAAADTVGAGEGEVVFYVTAYEAVIPYPRDMVPLDASIVGIVDRIETAEVPEGWSGETEA
ncbi:MAG: EutN/CcmL family microcompartment protein [Planctomycetes bacterium]|nr:EutN/CcmL family microcompartment protein [Planctomycetota bacterium]